MKLPKKTITFLTAIVILLVITLPLMTTTVDAATVLEKEAAAAASIGNSFEILARGRGSFKTEDIEDFQVNYRTRMNLCFLIAFKGERGVILQILEGSFAINETDYSFDDGIGVAGRPTQGDFNGTIIYGFRINVTSSTEEIGQLEFVGRVERTQNYGPLLIMKGRLTLDEQSFVFGQIGRIHRI